MICRRVVAVEGLALSRVICDGHDDHVATCERFAEARIIVVLRGSFAVDEGRRRTFIDPATALFVAAHQELSFRHPRGEGDVCLSIAGTLAARLTRQMQGVRLLTPIGYLQLQRLASSRRPDAVDVLRLEQTIADALASSVPLPTRGSKRDRNIAIAIAHEISVRFDEQVSLSQLARTVGVSPFYAARVFRRVFGTSIHQHRLELRLRHALTLLVDTDFDLSRIALDVGFANHGHFTNWFRRRFGAPPSEARRLASATGRQSRRGLDTVVPLGDRGRQLVDKAVNRPLDHVELPIDGGVGQRRRVAENEGVRAHRLFDGREQHRQPRD
jgi:AraC-like DNA-binding protein